MPAILPEASLVLVLCAFFSPIVISAESEREHLKAKRLFSDFFVFCQHQQPQDTHTASQWTHQHTRPVSRCCTSGSGRAMETGTAAWVANTRELGEISADIHTTLLQPAISSAIYYGITVGHTLSSSSRLPFGASPVDERAGVGPLRASISGEDPPRSP